VLTEACGRGAQGRLGLNDEQGRLVPTRVDQRLFAHAPISAVAAGLHHSRTLDPPNTSSAPTSVGTSLLLVSPRPS
jgi:hypothetical protein